MKEVQITYSVFGIQTSLFILLGFFALILLSTAGYGLYGINLITNASQEISDREVPLTRGITEALVVMLEGKVALETALGIDDFSQIEELQNRKARLKSSILEFNAYVAAMTWGSETEAFARSGGGLHFAEWQRLNLARDLVIQKPGTQQVQLAGVTNLYFGGFANNAFQAVASHEEFLRLHNENRTAEAAAAKEASLEHTARALRFFDLSIDSLSEIVTISNTAISKGAAVIKKTQGEVVRNIIIIFIVGFFFSLFISFAFVRRNILRPAESLRQTNKRLQELLNENYISAKLLVQKDRELTSTNLVLQERNKESDEIAKTLVRRDLELTETNERLQELDAVKSEFVSVAAHQLRTPLTGIKWTLTALLEEELGRLSRDQKKVISEGLEVTYRLIELINDLLDTARLEEGRFGFNFSTQSLRSVVEDIFKHHQSAAKEKGISLTLQLPKTKLPQLRFDAEKIGIVIDNLIDNAVKYTPSGGKVSVRVAIDKQYATLQVEDTGIGIPNEQFHRVFTKFFRAVNAQLAQTSGTGLGLYVASSIVKQHNGTLSFESKKDKGSTFTLSLPLPQKHNESEKT